MAEIADRSLDANHRVEARCDESSTRQVANQSTKSVGWTIKMTVPPVCWSGAGGSGCQPSPGQSLTCRNRVFVPDGTKALFGKHLMQIGQAPSVTLTDQFFAYETPSSEVKH